MYKDYMTEAWERLLAATQNHQIRSGAQLQAAAIACIRIETRHRRYINSQERDVRGLVNLFEDQL